MRLFYDRSVAIVLFAALAAVLIARGIVPAMSKIDSDFPGYFTAAKIVADGGPVERLYDVWFQQQMRRYNFRVQRIASIMLAALATLIKLARSGIAAAAAPSIGILGILTLLEAPATATYHFVLRETPTLGLSPS